jgi:hypothetical protein
MAEKKIYVIGFSITPLKRVVRDSSGEILGYFEE